MTIRGHNSSQFSVTIMNLTLSNKIERVKVHFLNLKVIFLF